MKVKSIPETSPERHYKRSPSRDRQIIGKLNERNAEPFRAVLLDVMRKDVAKYGKKT